jgi:hypothetical protein
MSSKLTGAPFTPIAYKYTPKINGGLYTGEPFQADAPWRNFPAEPSTDYLINTNLRSVETLQPHPQQFFHYPGGGYRPGNNTPTLPGIVNCNGLNIYAIDDGKQSACYWKPKPTC